VKEFLRKNFALLLAFILPIALIIVIALGVYLPSLFLSTNYDFIYSLCDNSGDYYERWCANHLYKRFSVVNGRLMVNSIDPLQDLDKDGVLDINENYTSRIFLHNTKNNESREISLEEAKTFTLNSLLTSPDGVSVSHDYDSGPDPFLFFDGGSSSGYYLTKGKSSKKLNFINQNDRYYYQNNFEFIGWVVPGRN